MHCPECESFTDITHLDNDVYLWSPLDHTYSKLGAFLGETTFDYSLLDNDIVRVSLNDEQLNSFLIQVGGVLSSQELAGTKAMTLPRGKEPDVQALGRVMTLDRLISLSHGKWLQEMIEQERYTSFFQPICNNRNRQVVGFEALFRGFETDQSAISPGHIFQTAADAGILFQVDLAARRSAVRRSAELGINNDWLFINFNPTAVYDPSYCLRTTVSYCDELGLKPEQIVFEVTETEKVEDIRHLRGILSFYRKAGFRVALDDVGAGYSGLNILQTLSPDLIKIDRHLIEDINNDPFRQNIVEHLTAMAHQQDIKVLAEGIETAAEANHLQGSSVDFVQGYYFGRPGNALTRSESSVQHSTPASS